MKRHYLSWVPAILIMMVIFSFSAKPAVKSAESSLTIAEVIMGIYEDITDEKLENDIRMEFLYQMDHYIRKGAHFIEYAILAAAIALPLWILRHRGRRLWLLSMLGAALYAATDEFHQSFVPGRSCELKDVMIDTAGAALGAMLFILVIKLFYHKKIKGSITIEPSE
ncbi:MAG TPA: VanZ family protein [Mobilitalea sp.]|nr:VanZ family protein [Mobilitalea sp.]